MNGYRRIDSFNRSQIDSVGVSESTIAIASDNRVTLISGTDRSEFEHEARIEDIAIDERVIILSSDQVTAYTRDGSKVWNRSFNSPYSVAALSGKALFGILERDQICTVDSETGQESFTSKRNRSGQPQSDRFIGIKDGFISATWSFLRCIDASGEEIFDQNLNTAIRDIGFCDGVIIASLQNDQLKGFDASTGKKRWETELPAKQLSPVSNQNLLISTEDGPKSIAADGSIHFAEGLAAGDIYTSWDGSVACSVSDGTVVSHILKQELIDVDILTESVGVGGTIDVSVTNLGETVSDVRIKGKLNNADLSPNERRIELTPLDPISTDFPVDSVRTDGKTEFSLYIEDRRIAGEFIEITDAAESVIAADADLQPIKIEDGIIELELSITNTGSIPFDSVQVFEDSEEKTNVGPSETWEKTITRSYEPEQVITVGVEIFRGNRRTELAPTCKLPEHPSIELKQKRDALHGRINGDNRVVWSDELVIDVPGADRARSPVQIEDGTLVVVLPIYEEGIARIELSGIQIADQAQMSSQDPLSRLTKDVNKKTKTRTQTDHSLLPDQPQTESRDEVTTETQTSEKRETRSQDETSSESDEYSMKISSDSGSRTSEKISIQRDISKNQVPIGHATCERITVRNDGYSTVKPTVVVGDNQFDTGKLAPSDTWQTERTHVFFSDSNTQLPEATVEQDGQIISSIPAKELTIINSGLIVHRAVCTVNDQYEIELENRTDSDRQVDWIKIGGQRIDIETQTLATGNQTVFTGRALTSEVSDYVKTKIMTSSPSGMQEEINTVTIEDSEANYNSNTLIQTAIGPATQVAGDYGTVVIVFENGTNESLSDVSIKAEGEKINDMLYSQAHREVLPPNERIEHYVDLKTEAGTIEFDISITYTEENATEKSRILRASGPAVKTEAEWTDKHRDSWTIDDKTELNLDIPPRISTSFQ